MECQRDPTCVRSTTASGLTTPDGMPMVWWPGGAGRREVSRVYGPDLMLAVLRTGGRARLVGFFYGGADGRRRAARRPAPGRASRGCGSPGRTRRRSGRSPRRRTRRSSTRINDSGARLVWVGLSTPKQERWMAEHVGRLRRRVLFGVGAAFDFHAGHLRQAPRWMQRSGLEWLYRLYREPRRLWRRYLRNNPAFVCPGPSTATGPGDARIVCRDRDPTRGREQRDEHDSSTTGRPSRGITSNWRRIMRIRRAVVTGGAGFLGRTCASAARAGYEVVCLDNFLTGRRTNVAHLTRRPALPARPRRRHRLRPRRGTGGPRAPLRLAGLADRLPPSCRSRP